MVDGFPNKDLKIFLIYNYKNVVFGFNNIVGDLGSDSCVENNKS